jgi:hypothetical protein
MLFDLGRKLVGRAILPPPLGAVVTVAEVALVACAVAKELSGDAEEED